MSCRDVSNDRFKAKPSDQSRAWILMHEDHEPATVRGVLEFADEQTFINLDYDYDGTEFVGGVLECNGIRYAVVSKNEKTLTVEVA